MSHLIEGKELVGVVVVGAPDDKGFTGPVKWNRDKNGLISTVNYVFNEDGTVNWRAMVKPQYLVPNRSIFESRKQPVPASIEGLPDNDLLILLAGIKDLAKLRGFTSVMPEVTHYTDTYAAVQTTIRWIGNFETEMKTIIFGDVGDATQHNTKGFGKVYLAAVAANRAFVRAVRNFLGVHVVGADEIGERSGTGEVEENNSDLPDAVSTLVKLMESKSVTFEKVKKKLISEGVPNAEEIEKVDQIPLVSIFDLIDRLKKSKA